MNLVDGSTPTNTNPDAGSTFIDASRPAQPGATVAADGAVIEPVIVDDFDAGTSEPDAAPQPTPDQQLSATLQNKLKNECASVFTNGNLSDELFAVRDQYERCVATCYVAAPCAEMKSMFCSQQKNSLAKCVSACDPAPADGFLCNDGTRIAHSYVCDLGISKNCPDNSDEQSCGGDTFTCGTGAKIPRKLVCDLVAICSDDSDEKQGCATVACN